METTDGVKVDISKRLARALLAALVFLTPLAVHAQGTRGGSCSYELTPVSANVLPAGESDFIGIITDPGCAWLAESSQPWITITSATSGTGPGPLAYTVAPNTGPQRSGQITVADQVFQIVQFSGCQYTLQPPTQNFPIGGGTGNILVQTTSALCPWTATTNDSWIDITAGSSGTGGGTVSFSVAANPANARTGIIAIAGIQYAITQNTGCSFALTPTASAFGSGSASGSFVVTTTPQCSWTATTQASWIVVANGQGRQGSGTLNFSIGANTGPARSGTISVNGTIFTINQSDGCTYSLSPSIATISSDAAQGTFLINTNAGCAWTVQANAPWISIVSSTSGTGPAQVTYAAEENTGPPRAGSITAAGRTFTLNQSDGCIYFATPTVLQFEPEGGEGNVAMVTGSSCAWDSMASVDWITLDETETRFGPATVLFDVAENTGPPRSGSITMESEVVFVQQANGCSYPLAPQEADYPAAGGSGSFLVNTGTGCAWNAFSDKPWLSIVGSASGSGPGSVAYAVAENTTDLPRTGTIDVEGQLFTVTQDEACVFDLDPVARQVPADEGTASFDVGTDEACFWTAVSGASWLTVTENETGFGPATVTYAFEANEGPARQATISVENSLHTVTQEDNCGYAVDPLEESYPFEGGTGTIDVTANPSCPWTAVSAQPWIVVTSAPGGTGDGAVAYTVEENPGAARAGTLTVAGETVVIDQAARPVGADLTRLGIVGPFGYTDLTDYVIESQAKGAAQEFVLPDPKLGTTTFVMLDMLAVNSQGDVTGIADMRVEDPEGFPLDSLELPVAGRIQYKGKIQDSIFPNPEPGEDGLSMLSVVNANGKFSLTGRSADKSWQLKAKGNEKNTQFYSGDDLTGMIGQEGFVLKLNTKAPDAKGKSQAVVLGWVAEDGEVVISRETFAPLDEKLKKWTADAPLLSPFSPFVPIPGGTSAITTKFYDPVKGKPGKIAVKAQNGSLKATANGQLFTTFEEAAAEGFIPDDLQSFLQKVKIASPGATTQINTDWDASLLVPAAPPMEP